MRVGRPVELVDVEFRRREKGEVAVRRVHGSDPLDLDTVFADNAGPGLHGGECPGRASRILYEEETGVICRLAKNANESMLPGQMRKLPDSARGFYPEKDLLLIGFLGTLVCRWR